MSLLTDFPSGYHKPEPSNKSFDMIVREWSRQQFGGDEVVEEIRKALNTGVTTYYSGATGSTPGYQVGGSGAYYPWASGNNGATYPTADSTTGALTTSYPAGSSTALRLENLDNTMTSVLATAEHLKIFRFLHKEPSKQPFYQWNRRESYGSTRGFFGFQEGGLPTGGRGQWSRNGAYVKFLGTKGGVTHPAVLTNILGGMSVDPVAEDQLGRTMDFMQRIERAIMYGDEDIADSTGGDSNYDGLLKLLTKQRVKNVIDMKGKPLTMDAIANVASRLVSEGKLLSLNDITLFMSPQSIEDFGKMRYQTVLNNGVYQGPGTSVDRAELTSSARNNLIAGLSIVGQATSFGVIPFEWSIFTEPVEGNVPLFTADPNAPAAPSATITGATAGVGGFTLASDQACLQTVSTGSNFRDSTGTTPVYYHYRVSSVNDAGESLATALTSTPVNPISTQEVRLRWNRVTGSGLAGARAYRIYRCTVSGASDSSPNADATTSTGEYRWQYVGYVADPSAASSTVVNPASYDAAINNTAGSSLIYFVDRNGTPELYNNFLGGSTIAPLICRNSADLCIAQMSPLLKMPLAPTSTTFEYLLLLYHTLVLKAPERQFIFKNVGKLS